MIFNNFKQFERAKVFVKPQYNSYLGAFEGRIRKVYKKNGRYFADVLMYLSDGDYTFALRTENIFLKNPDLYPKLPTLPENTYKRGGGNKMIRMPRLFA